MQCSLWLLTRPRPALRRFAPPSGDSQPADPHFSQVSSTRHFAAEIMHSPRPALPTATITAEVVRRQLEAPGCGYLTSREMISYVVGDQPSNDTRRPNVYLGRMTKRLGSRLLRRGAVLLGLGVALLAASFALASSSVQGIGEPAQSESVVVLIAAISGLISSMAGVVTAVTGLVVAKRAKAPEPTRTRTRHRPSE